MTRAPFWAPPLLALQFLTRVPVPVLARLSGEQAADGLARAMAWLPPVGSLVGLVNRGRVRWRGRGVAAGRRGGARVDGRGPTDRRVSMRMRSPISAMRSAAPRGARTALRIMKDSRIGSYGTLGLGLAVALRLAAIVALPAGLAVAAIVAAATMGPAVGGGARRGRCAGARRRDGGARGEGAARAGAAGGGLGVAGVVPLVLLRPVSMLACGVIGAVFLLWLAAFLRRRIGGSTGDCLGFAAYVGQLVVLLAAAAA